MSDVIFSRINRVLASRTDALDRNILAIKGGTPYVQARLWRAPNESDLSWSGVNADGMTVAGCTGRINRACNVNDAGRIASKINQYLFAEPAKRTSIDADWAKAVTPDGRGIDLFWQDVSELITANGWCWISADRGAPEIDPTTGKPAARSVAQRPESDRIRWQVYPATAVRDWCFDEAGHLLWLVTASMIYDAKDPFVQAQEYESRTLWRRGEGLTGATYQTWTLIGDDYVIAAEGSVSSKEIPFVLVGTPSAEPWWFDDVESIQAQVLNLDSLYVEILVRTCYPQLVIPSSAYENVATRLIERDGAIDGSSVVEVVKEIVRGMDTPFVESAEDKGITRTISPSMADMQALPTEIARKRRLLFDNAGLALFNKETRQVQSAESKQFDHLDTEMTLRSRASMLQQAEKAMVDISKALDSTFQAYEPEWSMSFDVSDLAEDSAALVTLQQIGSLTLTQRKVSLRAATAVLSRLVRLSEEESEAIKNEIDGLKDIEFPSLPLGDLE